MKKLPRLHGPSRLTYKLASLLLSPKCQCGLYRTTSSEVPPALCPNADRPTVLSLEDQIAVAKLLRSAYPRLKARQAGFSQIMRDDLALLDAFDRGEIEEEDV